MTENRPKPKSQQHKAERSKDEWEEYNRTRDPDKKHDLDKQYKKREDAHCQEPDCKKEAVHHDKRENRSGRCLEHWEGDSDDNG